MVLASKATRSRILDVSQSLIQARGFSAFSFADIADVVGIRKASIHHHFPTKGDLATALVRRYRDDFASALAAICSEHKKLAARLDAYQSLFSKVLREGDRLCMCGMLAADFGALPDEVRAEVRAFFDDNERWLAKILTEGKRNDETSFRGTAVTQARVVLSAFEGAMLVARTYGDVGRFTAVARRVLADMLRVP